MANLDAKRWYQISNHDGGLCLTGTSLVLSDAKTSVSPYGAVFLRLSNTSDTQQQWQSEQMPNYMGVATDSPIDSGVLVAGSTKPIMGTPQDFGAAAWWNAPLSGEGTYWMENVANGSDWRLNVTGGFLTMSSNITGEQDKQQFKFVQQDLINNAKYSSVDALFTASATAPGSAAEPTTTTSSSGESTASSSSSSSGLSTGATVGIGVAVGLVALIGIISGTMCWIRRKKKRLNPAVPATADEVKDRGPTPSELAMSPRASEPAVSPQHSELAARPVPLELPVSSRQVAELDGGDY
ncbi:hypothetical protein F5Y15DRAFT_423439 [Xylariaceae sp. FL0016]|nr:hypothetical protein F5Y15DRAFT_423439 [Xylariaceae sp. FL0016]